MSDVAYNLEFAFRTPWSWIALLVTLVAAFLVTPRWADWLGWGRNGARMVILSLGCIAIPTLVARIGYMDFSVGVDRSRACLAGFDSPWLAPAELLNMVLFIPFALALLIASRNVWVALAGVTIAGCGLELLQAATGLGVCEQQDAAEYLIGGALALLAVRMFATAPMDRSSDRPQMPSRR